MKKIFLVILTIILCSGCAKQSPAFPIEQDHCFMYARQQLDETSKEIYDTLYEGIMEMEEEIEINEDDKEYVSDVYQAISRDHPEIFWIYENKFGIKKSGFFKNTFRVVVHYEYTKEEVESYQKQLEEKTREVLTGIAIDAQDYDKVKYVYDFIIDQTKYNEEASDNQNILSVMLHGESVCAGYAKSMQYLLEKLGVKSHTLVGKSKQSILYHAWNMVMMDGEYYYVDTTFGDPITEDGSDIKTYAFLGMSSKEMEQLYTADSTYEQTDAIANNYFVKMGFYIETIDAQEIVSLLQGAITDDHILRVKCSDPTLYSSYKQHMIEESQIFYYLQQLGVRIDTISYSEYEDVHVMNINF